MANTEREHFYFVDPGIGEKGVGCPYSFYKDGHDIESFIIPPKGYELTGFNYEPYPEDIFYDGKIVAQYEKDPLFESLHKNFLKYVLAIFIIGLLAVLGFFIYHNYFKSTPSTEPKSKPKTEIKALTADTVDQKQISDTFAIVEDTTLEEYSKEDIGIEEIIDDNVLVTVPPIEKNAELAVQKDEITTDSYQEQESPSKETLTKEQFQQEFWYLIHRKESHMRTYGDLYRKYKELDLKTREANYLYSVILENTTAFDIWKEKLLSIPDDELKSVNTINALIQKIEEYE